MTAPPRSPLGRASCALALLLAIALAGLPAGCAAPHKAAPAAAPADPAAPAATPNTDPAAVKAASQAAWAKISTNVWNMHHRVQLLIPGHPPLSFAGMMRFDAGARSVRVAGVAGLGLQMFALRLSPDEAVFEYIHPLLRKIPRFEKRMTACIRAIWFDYLQQICSRTKVRLHGLSITPSTEVLAGPWPQHIVYVDERAPFTLNIRLLQAEQEATP